MPIVVGSLAWMKENDPSSYKAYRSKKAKESYARTKEKVLTRVKNYRDNNREKVIQTRSKWRASHREQINRNHTSWRKNNRPRLLSYWDEWRTANREKINEKSRNWRSLYKDKVNQKRADGRKTSCPMCDGLKTTGIVCTSCARLVARIENVHMPSRETINKYLMVLGDKRQWQNVIAQRKAHKSHKDLLKTLTLLMAGKSVPSSK